MQMFLIDRLSKAAIDAPSPAHVAVQSVTIKRETRTCIFQHPNSAIVFKELNIPRDSRLKSGCGIKDVSWNKVLSPVIFRISIVDRRGQAKAIFETEVDARAQLGRKWFDVDCDLRQYHGKDVTVMLQTLVPEGGDASYCWAAWSDPCIVDQSRTVLPPLNSSKASRVHKNVLLISSDALRADFLGCYGHPIVRTPNLDQLAKDGILFTQGRAQTPTTMGSYASILTSTHALEHNLMAEWGTMNPDLISLPQVLSAAGYQTVIAASESELVEDNDGFLSHFAENIPCLAVPAQSGDVTTRQFVDWLDRRPDKPFFGWLQYFDTHPPATPPAPFNTLYYQQDPCSNIAAFDSEKVSYIRGIESVLRIEASLPGLMQGEVDFDMLTRLRSTAEVFCGKRETGPDLVPQLTAMGATARRGLSVADFGLWLSEQVVLLEQSSVTPELIDWLNTLLPALRDVEKEILSWLDGVKDFRYPVAQYMGEVSYMDQNVGSLFNALKERGIYDETTILLTSPHGELLDDNGLYFHHHALMERVLRIPAILKPRKSSFVNQGMHIDGIFDQVDMMPTILESLGVDVPPDLAGTSRWSNVKSGKDIAEHDSFSVDIHGTMFSITRSGYIFMKAVAPYFVSADWKWMPGDKALFRLSDPMSYTENLVERQHELAAEMERALDDFVSAHNTIKSLAVVP